MSAEAPIVRVWVASETTSGHRFLADVCAMLVAIATRSGGHLSFEGTGASRNGKARAPALRAAMAAELGVHRAQVIPEANPIGRVETVLVGVELVTAGQVPTDDQPSGPVLKTYNYFQGSVFVHATGEQHSLADALSGNAG